MRARGIAWGLTVALLCGLSGAAPASAGHDEGTGSDCPLESVRLQTRFRVGADGCYTVTASRFVDCDLRQVVSTVTFEGCGEFEGELLSDDGSLAVGSVELQGSWALLDLIVYPTSDDPVGIDVNFNGVRRSCCAALTCETARIGRKLGCSTCERVRRWEANGRRNDWGRRCAKPRGTCACETAGTFTIVAKTGCNCECDCEEPEPCLLLVLDEDAIDNGGRPNFFSDVDVNDQIAELGVRQTLRYWRENIGREITLYSGQVGDEGWFAVKHIPSSWHAAGPTGDGARNYLLAGPGLGTYDRNGQRESLTDKIPDVTPLRATGLKMLEGKIVCAVVYDSDVSINYGPLNGSLKGATLGTVAMEVLEVTRLDGQSSSSLPKVRVRIVDASEHLAGPIRLFTEAPAPQTSSIPMDLDPR